MIPVLYPSNRLNAPTVVVSDGDTAGFPKSRLSDGDVSLLWKSSSTGTVSLVVDQGTSIQPIDTLILAAGHTLAGISVTLASGASGGSVTTRGTVLVTSSALHRLTLTGPFTDKVWVVQFTATTVQPALPELVLSLGVPLPSPPVLRGQELGQRSNVIDLESYGGAEWNLVRGPVRWTATYPCLAMTAADRDALLAAHRALDGGARACYLTDGEGVTRWVNWADRQLRLTSTLPDRYDLALSFREVLGAA